MIIKSGYNLKRFRGAISEKRTIFCVPCAVRSEKRTRTGHHPLSTFLPSPAKFSSSMQISVPMVLRWRAQAPLVV